MRALGRMLSIALFCALFLPTLARAEVIDRVVAVVNDSIVTLSELNAAAALAAQELGEDGRDEMETIEAKSKLLDGIIEQKLVKQAADRAGIDVSEIEIDNAVEEVKGTNGFTQEALVVALARSGLTYKEYRSQIKEQLREVKFVDRAFRSKVSLEREDIEEYYKQNVEKFIGPAAIRIRMIVLSGEDKAAQSERLGAVLRELRAGHDFSDLARQYSDGPNAADGGDLGFVPVGDLDPAVAEAASELSPSEVSRPIASESGISIFQLVENRASEPLPLEAVESRIRKTLYDRAVDENFENWLRDVRRVAHIEVRL
jgi:peptidyl-prolyl cis-trans isomerase SurA